MTILGIQNQFFWFHENSSQSYLFIFRKLFLFNFDFVFTIFQILQLLKMDMDDVITFHSGEQEELHDTTKKIELETIINLLL